MNRTQLGELLDLPKDALYGAERLHFTAGERLYVENHRGVHDYSSDLVTFAVRGASYEVLGSGMRIAMLSRDTLLVEGDIRQLVRRSSAGGR